MVDHTLTVQIIDKTTSSPLPWELLLDGQSLGNRQPSYAIVLPEGNHIIGLPPCLPGGNYKSHIWKDNNGNVLGEETVLSLNLISDQQIILLLEFDMWIPSPLLFLQFAMLGLVIVGTGYIVWHIIKKHRK